jgi:hypothetical protein
MREEGARMLAIAMGKFACEMFELSSFSLLC